jgi:tartrate dehydratase beta subunit/fumarate hydratase class I family protein
MLIDSEELKLRLLNIADARWDSAFDDAIEMVEELEVETKEANEKECGDRLEHCGKIFTCRVKGPHRLHDDYEQTDGMPQRWMDTSLGRLTDTRKEETHEEQGTTADGSNS